MTAGDATSHAARTAIEANVPLRRGGGGALRALDAMLDLVGGTRGCCLTFHRVAPSEEWRALPDQGFTLELERLDALLSRLLAAGWDIVTMDEAMRRTPGARRFVNFSIDDAYRDTWELIAPLFRKHGVPVTVYVTTGIPNGDYELWYVGLETILVESREVLVRGREGRADERVALPDQPSRSALYRRLRAAWGDDDPLGPYHEFCRDNGYDPRSLHERHAITWSMLRELGDDRFVEIGAHTVMHARISKLDPCAALAEMAESRRQLENRLGIPVRHFAFPFGRRNDCGERDFDLAREAGFITAATTSKGLIRPGASSNPYRLPRNTLNGLRGGGATIQSHLTGLSGALARLTRRD
jgi:peptidoglycan/xylan/chitin deacetylase (PgdA/CDA1 family)